jgi:hypothetical protein
MFLVDILASAVVYIYIYTYGEVQNSKAVLTCVIHNCILDFNIELTYACK